MAECNKVIKYTCLYVEHHSKFNYKHNTNYTIVHYFVRFASFFFFFIFFWLNKNFIYEYHSTKEGRAWNHLSIASETRRGTLDMGTSPTQLTKAAH